MAAFRFALVLLAASVAFGQSASKTFHLTTPPNIPALNEIATILRTVGNIRQINADAAKFDITVTGRDVDIAFAEWAIQQLDTETPKPAEYAVPGTSDVVNIVYLANSPENYLLSELVVNLRALEDIQRIFTYTPAHGIVMRTTAAQTPMALWLVQQLDLSPDDQNRWQPHQYVIQGTPEQEIKVVYLIHQMKQSDLNEMVTTMRTVADIHAIFTRSQPQGIAFRGTLAQAQLGEWLFQQLDAEPDNQMRAQSHEYILPDTADGVTRVYYLNTARVNDIAAAIRSEWSAEHPRIFVCSQHKALAVRGTPEMIAVADRVVKEHDVP